MTFRFRVTAQDPNCSARLGVIESPRGTFETPLFMPVGTAATVKSLLPEQVAETGAGILLVNAYHMHLQPGEDIVAQHGGLHAFMNWPRMIITDSGGYQVFSLPNRKIEEEGVRFQVERGGQPVMLTPEGSIAIQSKLGADIAMAFDECVAYPAPYAYAKEAMERTVRWAKRCKDAHAELEAAKAALGSPRDPGTGGGGSGGGSTDRSAPRGGPGPQALFGIVQGSTYADLRRACAEEIAALDLPGIAIGGLSVGEGLDVMQDVLSYTVPYLPVDRPRYLMGVGLPEDILAHVEAGMDMSDCIIPTKYARSGQLFTRVGRLRITKRQYRKDRFPVDTNCRCYTCSHYTRAYLHHLFQADEILGQSLASVHNVHFYVSLMQDIRTAIAAGRFVAFKDEFLANYLREEKKNRNVR